MSSVQLFSGGLDSVLLWHLRRPDDCAYVTWGAPYEASELQAIWQLQRLGGPKVQVLRGAPLLPADQDGHVPHRNLMLLATVAAHYPAANEILIGSVLGESSADKSTRFLRAASRVISASEGRDVTVQAPLARGLKRWWVKRYLRAGGDVRLLACTRSCYRGTAVGCGRCPACFRRWQALQGLCVPFATEVPAWCWWDDARARGALAAVQRVRAQPVAGWPGIALLNADAAWRVARARRSR